MDIYFALETLHPQFHYGVYNMVLSQWTAVCSTHEDARKIAYALNHDKQEQDRKRN